MKSEETKIKKQIFIFLLIILAFAGSAFGQAPENIEQELVSHIKNIQKFSNYTSERNYEMLEKENKIFKEKILKSTKNALTLKHTFTELAEYLSIATSEDGKFRIYSWDTEGGGTMHFFDTVYQYQDADGKVYSKSIDLAEGDAGSFVYDIFTVETKNGKVYLACSTSIFSTSNAYQSVDLFKIENNSLNNRINLIKTRTGLTNSLGFEYDFFSVVDRKERPIKLIVYDKLTKSIKIPLVLADEKFQYGKVTDKFIVYKFNGTYFVKTK